MRKPGVVAGLDLDNPKVQRSARGAILPESGFTGLDLSADGGGAAE